VTENAYLVGLRLSGKKVVVIGGGTVAQRRVPVLIAHGAQVHVVARAATPAVEALATGTRVAVSAGTSIEEAAGPHGEPIASRDVDGWRDAMRRALDAPAPTEAERAARRAWARRFDWRRTAQRSLAMYRAVLDGAPLPAELLDA
jgi:glycosyltransferase involved in cell wall biosynthesis